MASSTEIRATFHEAALHLSALAAAIPASAWDKPGLGEWNVRDLLGHASRSLLTVEQYLEAGAPGEPELASAADYYLRLTTTGALNAPGIAERGREAGRALGDDPTAAVRAMVERVFPKADAAPDDVVIPTAAGTMRLLDYLPTRIFELTVHSLDLAAALDSPALPPKSALAISLELAARLAAEQQAGDLLLAITGRRPLPADYSVL